jgi:ABC-type multidrug transport system fused ATPase/permease subunit
LLISGLIQVFLSGLDLIGVAIIGILGALSVNGVASLQPGSRIEQFLRLVKISELSFQSQVSILGLSAAGLLILRTACSVYVARRTLRFLSRRNARITSDLTSRLLSKPLLEIQERTVQSTLYAVTYGINSITMGIISTLITALADSVLLIVMFIGLFVVDPIIAFSTLFLFGGIGLALYKYLHEKALSFGRKDAELTIAVSEKFVEVLSSYRESVVRNRRNFYVRNISELKSEASHVQAELYFMPSVSKYVIETSIVIGALGVSALQFLMNDAVHAVSTLAVFLAAGTRIAPAVMRVQQAAIQIRGCIGTATPTLDLFDSLTSAPESPEVSDVVERNHLGFSPRIEIQELSVVYPNAKVQALNQVSLILPEGKMLAVVGPSGAGKTTFVDALLGILSTQTGKILISGMKPSDAVVRWPGAIGYVPQNVEIINDSILGNIALGFPKSEVNEDVIWECLRFANLDNVVRKLDAGIHSQVGEKGTKLSGGQRQRLGFARALFTNPRLLVLDEATSALDSETEKFISDAIESLRGRTTIVTIAHRLSTVRNADSVMYLEDGAAVAIGTFEEVRGKVSNFDRQARLLGL